MSRIREILASKKRCLTVALLAYAIALLLAVSLFGRQMNSVKSLLPMSWAIGESTKSQTEDFDDEVTYRIHGAKPKNIAIGGGITSIGVQNLTSDNMATKMSLFTTFIPSFCETASPHFKYHFYFAYDQSDPMFTNPAFLSAFESTFKHSLHQSCTSNKQPVSIRTVHCNHDHKPTWAQNDAMLEAYLDDAEYYYRINDDTRLITRHWAERFIEVLNAYVPINVGVVGPKHLGGNTLILTYDFVHRTHIEIFGFYYPRLFKDWWGDDWITNVYQPYRSTKEQTVYLEHTMGMRRYEVSVEVERKLGDQVAKDKEILQR